LSEDDSFELLRRSAEDFFANSFGVFEDSLLEMGSSSLRPLSRVDLSLDDVTVTFDVPGVNKEDVSVTCTEDAVSVEAEIRKSFRTSASGYRGSVTEVIKYSKRIDLPVAVDPDKGTAKFRNGIVVVKLPRVHKGKPVKVSGGRSKR
jgi:HSP20 family protein